MSEQIGPSEFEIPLCPYCGENCILPTLKIGGSTTALNYGYLMTCGKKECLHAAHKGKHVATNPGTKYVLPHFKGGLSNIQRRRSNPVCRCGRPKGNRRSLCPSCLSRSKHMTLKRSAGFLGSIISESVQKKIFRDTNRQKAVDDFDELTRKARLLLKK